MNWFPPHQLSLTFVAEYHWACALHFLLKPCVVITHSYLTRYVSALATSQQSWHQVTWLLHYPERQQEGMCNHWHRAGGRRGALCPELDSAPQQHSASLAPTHGTRACTRGKNTSPTAGSYKLAGRAHHLLQGFQTMSPEFPRVMSRSPDPHLESPFLPGLHSCSAQRQLDEDSTTQKQQWASGQEIWSSNPGLTPWQLNQNWSTLSLWAQLPQLQNR